MCIVLELFWALLQTKLEKFFIKGTEECLRLDNKSEACISRGVIRHSGDSLSYPT